MNEKEACKVLEGVDVFESMSKEVLPLANQLTHILERYGIEKLANLTVQADGYLRFCTHESELEMVRIDNANAASIQYNFKKVIELQRK